jgi:hypothetical protein
MPTVLSSYVKTTAACVTLFVMGLVAAFVVRAWLPSVVASIVAVFGSCVALVAGVFACSGAVVLKRFGQSKRGELDWFLALNRSREPTAIASSPARHTGVLRRWLVRHLLGHEFVVGDWVEIKPWHEIRATLDAQGRLEQLPFMPEMLALCGRHARVFRCVHRIFDYRKSRQMRHMHGTVLLVGAVCSGSAHGSCEASCHTVWKAAWLRRIDRLEPNAPVGLDASRAAPAEDVAVLRFGTEGPRYSCQLTQLHAASRPVGEWNPLNFVRPLVAGNVTLSAFVVGWLTYLFNTVQHFRQGVSFPMFEAAKPAAVAQSDASPRVGDQVVVRGSGEIRATLNDQLVHRGLGFEIDMLKHCGHRYLVQREVGKLIDIVSGEMRTMKTPAYVLAGVHFSGERQLFNAQYEPLFWRNAWLRR